MEEKNTVHRRTLQIPKKSFHFANSSENTLPVGHFTITWLSCIQYCVKDLISVRETMQQRKSSLFVHSCVESSSTQLDLKLSPHSNTVPLSLSLSPPKHTHTHTPTHTHKHNKAETGASITGMTVL